MSFISEDTVRSWLQGKIIASGKTLSEWSLEHSIDPSSVSRILSGQRPPNDAVLDILGLTRVNVYLIVQKDKVNGA